MGLRHLALSSSSPPPLTRRGFLRGASCCLLSARASRAWAHNSAGAVSPPESPPALALTFHDGDAGTLQGMLSGHVTALQLMFTSCQATCPIQGALFAATAKELDNTATKAQLLSLSIDPARDTAAVLREWLRRFSSSPRWRAARPDKDQLAPLVAFLKSQNPGPDPHTAQVYFFNRKGQLVLRSVDFPSSSEIVRILRQLVRIA